MQPGTKSSATPRAFPLQALACTVLFLLAELVARPFTSFAIADEWSYAKSANLLARTGHIVYNGWSTAMLGWQLYPAALAIRIFGYSYDVTRMTTLAAAAVCTALLHRIAVRAGLSERNATLATLAVMLSPIVMQLSVTFMTDISGVLALLLALYGCLRALQASTENRTIAWLAVAVATCSIVGSARQLGWLGTLVLVPCTLLLLRRHRRVLLAGSAATLAGWAFIFWCLHWSKTQPWFLPEPIIVHPHGLRDLGKMSRELARFALELPFLLTPLLLAFVPRLRRAGRGFWIALAAFALLYTAVAVHLTPTHGPGQILEPLLNDWLTPAGFYYPLHAFIAQPPPVVLGTVTRILLTALSLLATVATVYSLAHLSLPAKPVRDGRLGWTALLVLTVPTIAAYSILLIPRSLHELFDRYLIGLTPFVAVIAARVYQDFIRPRLPLAVPIAIAVVALFSVATVHDLFALDRARHSLATELTTTGIEDTAIDGGFEYNDEVELRHSPFLNDERIVNPPGSYRVMDPHRAPTCDGRSDLDEHYRHGHPRYGFAFNPQACAGPAPFAPVAYASWLKLRPVVLYAVHYQGPYQSAPAP